MPLVGKLVAQKVSRWACPGIVGLPWRGGCPQVGARRAQAPEMGPDMGRAKRYAQCHFGDMSAHKSVMVANAPSRFVVRPHQYGFMLTYKC